MKFRVVDLLEDQEQNRYTHGPIECIDAIRAALSPDEFRGFCKGNVLKYIWRERYKGGDSDIRKALAYVRYILSDESEVTADGPKT